MTRFGILAYAGMVVVSVSGCLDRGGLDVDGDGGTGGMTDAGTATGGRGSGGGTGPGTGGTGTGTGGTGTGAGGAGTGTGGGNATGGRLGTGGSPATGGRTSTGGNQNTGGVRGTGGVKATGGATGTGGGAMCGPVCDIYCPYGNVIDARGCATCQCNQGPICPAIGCGVACPNGYVKDAKGCDTCMCNPETKPCTTDECGPAPTAATIVLCAATTAAGSASGAGASGTVAPGDVAALAPPVPPPTPVPPVPFVCQRGTNGICSWYAGTCRVCPALACTLACTNGFQVGPDGCRICACNPPLPTTACAGLGDHVGCVANAGCTWLAPGCGEPALAAAGCYAKASIGCTSDAQCGSGHQCLKRVVNPCATVPCPQCAAVQTICQ